jgi:hypothetical protein
MWPVMRFAPGRSFCKYGRNKRRNDAKRKRHQLSIHSH